MHSLVRTRNEDIRKRKAHLTGDREVQAIEEALEVDFPERPEGEVPEVDTSEWLFDTARDYIEQMDFYKEHKEE